MLTFTAMGTILAALGVTFWLTRFSYRHFSSMIKGHKISLRPAFNGFREKIWMTLGLGIIFFGLYFCLVYFSSILIHQQDGLFYFLLLYNHPVEFIYLGLFLFSLVTLSIYLVRMLIKFIFILHNKHK